MNPFELIDKIGRDTILFAKDAIACGIHKAIMAQIITDEQQGDYLEMFKSARAEVVEGMSTDDLLWTWQTTKADKVLKPSCVSPSVWEKFGEGTIEAELEVARKICASASKVLVMERMVKELKNED